RMRRGPPPPEGLECWGVAGTSSAVPGSLATGGGAAGGTSGSAVAGSLARGGASGCTASGAAVSGPAVAGSVASGGGAAGGASGSADAGWLVSEAGAAGGVPGSGSPEESSPWVVGLDMVSTLLPGRRGGISEGSFPTPQRAIKHQVHDFQCS